MSFGFNRMRPDAAVPVLGLCGADGRSPCRPCSWSIPGSSIAQTFFATAAAFLGLSLYGYTTKRDLSGFGTFLIMGVVGLLVAMLINMFLHRARWRLAISAIGVLLFAGLTAYDTQRIKSMYLQLQGTEFLGKAAIMGALSLYLDFINMFQFLLSFMGNRR